MSESSPPSPWPDLVKFQLSLLDLYEALLDSPGWDEAKSNATLKTFMSSVLALVRVQRSLGGQVLTAQQEMIRRYRAQLDTWLEEHGETREGGAHGSAGGTQP